MPESSRTTVPLLIALLALCAGSVEAGDSPWFARAKLGQVETDATFGPPVFGRIIDDDDSTAAVELGYRFGRNLALQAAYHDLGEYDALDFPCPPGQICPQALVPVEEATLEVTGVSLSAVPRLPLGERVSLFAKIGVIEWEADLVSDGSGDTLQTFDDHELLGGLGVAYDLPSGLGFQLEVEGFDLDVTTLTAGVGWRF
jgi:hypothetical protein